MSDILTIFQPFTQVKNFSAGILDDAVTACNNFITGTLNVDPDHVYTAQVVSSYVDAGVFYILLQYTYVMPYPPPEV